MEDRFLGMEEVGGSIPPRSIFYTILRRIRLDFNTSYYLRRYYTPINNIWIDLSLFLIFNFILLGIFSSFVFFFYKSYILAKSKENKEGMRNSALLVIAISCIVAFYLIYSILIGWPLIPYPFDALMLMWCGIIVGIQFLYKKFHKPKEALLGTYTKKSEFTPKKELQRKATHLIVLLLIAVYFGLGGVVYDFIDFLIYSVDQMNVNIWGISGLYFPRENSTLAMALLGMIGAFFLILIPETFRLFSPDNYMLRKAPKLMRKNEEFAPAAPVCLITASMIPFVTIPNLNIAFSGVTMAVIGDALASIFGRKYGKYKISFFPSKSYEGLVAGVLFSFLSGLTLLIFEFDLIHALLLALIGSLILGFVDLLDIQISDNILNPIFVCLGMFLFSFI